MRSGSWPVRLSISQATDLSLFVTFVAAVNQSACDVAVYMHRAGGCGGPTVERAILISCAEVRRQLSNYFEDDVTAELRSRVYVHLLCCPGCKALHDGVRNVITLAGAPDFIALPSGFSLRLYRRLTRIHPSGSAF